MRFVSSFYNSLYNLSWLKERRQKSAGSWGYFFLFILLLSLLSVIPLAIDFQKIGKEIRSRVASEVPNFQASVIKGTLTVEGLNQPYIYKDKESDYLLVVDTKSSSTPEVGSFIENPDQDGILVSKDRIEFYDGDSHQSKVQFLDKMPDFSFDKTKLVALGKTYLSLPFIALFTLLIIPFSFIGFLFGKLFAILVVGLIVLVVAKIAGKKWSFAELFRVGLVATTLPSLIALVFSWIGIQFGYIHFMALLAFMLAVVFTKDQTVASVDNTSIQS